LRPFSWSLAKESIKHLEDLPLIDGRVVDVLVGIDHSDIIVPLEIRQGAKNEPYAMRCELGWVVRGRLPKALESPGGNIAIDFVHQADGLDEKVRDFFNAERFGSKSITDGPTWSKDDLYAMKLIEEGTRKLPDEPGYEVELPWKPGPRPENDKLVAKRRFKSLQKKLSTDQQLKADYTTAVQKYVERGYAIKNYRSQRNGSPRATVDSTSWSLKDKTTRKLRVVFDSAAKYFGKSLNDCLFTGPSLQNDLANLLITFREFAVASTADIESMYNRINMKKDDARFHRFLWTDDPLGEPDLYEMTTVVFGDAPSPCQAVHVLRRTAEEFGSPELLDLTKRHFYMDDFLTSYQTKEEAVRINTSVKNTLENGNFKLGKWMSNSEHVQHLMNPQATGKEVDLAAKTGTVLGIVWNPRTDCISFALKNWNEERIIFSRRGLLSKVSGIFDPLGTVAPFTVKGKIMIQNLTRGGLQWDDELDEREQDSLEEWIDAARFLPEITFSRCLFPNDVKQTQLHTFCDASQEAFAAVVYLRHRMDTGFIRTVFVMAKTRLAPTKPISIARLELNGALLGSRLAVTVEGILRTRIDQRYFWTDSSAVRGWLSGKATFYKPFVSNRIGEVHMLTKPEEWRHIPGKKIRQTWLLGPNLDQP
jgi:Pao retrotransposon peptidase.